MRRVEDITVENLKASYPPAFYSRLERRKAALTAMQDEAAADYTAEVERRLAILHAAYPRHTFRWINSMGMAFVTCECKRGSRHLSDGFMRETCLRAEAQMREHGDYARLTPARKSATLILWQQVEAIMALYMDADETFNVAI